MMNGMLRKKLTTKPSTLLSFRVRGDALLIGDVQYHAEGQTYQIGRTTEEMRVMYTVSHHSKLYETIVPQTL